jgi:DNA-directed RNA polymerase sigma subunit (sigma70/sigma32)
MNLRDGKGKVPVQTESETTPWFLVPFPTREEFNEMYKLSTPETRERYWQMLVERSEGSSLADIGRRWGITRERARQIEAKFLRRVSRQWKESNP